MRGKSAPKRILTPDPRYASTLVAKFTNYLMERGKKSVAQTIVYDAFDRIEEKTKKKPMDVFEEALKNITPQLEVRSRRVGGANYQVPMPVRGDRRNALAFRWLIAAAKSRKGKPMCIRLSDEIMAAADSEGSAVKKKQDVHKMAESNRAFAHFARY